MGSLVRRFPRPVVPGSRKAPCADCEQQVWVSPSGEADAARYGQDVVVLCPLCAWFRARSTPGFDVRMASADALPQYGYWQLDSRR